MTTFELVTLLFAGATLLIILLTFVLKIIELLSWWHSKPPDK